MPETHEREFRGRAGHVLNWASIIDPNALEQALQIGCGHVTEGHVAVMPDAHFGMGACVGTAIVTKGGIYPAAVGVDIGCGMIATRTDVPASTLELGTRRRLRNAIEERVPSGVGTNHQQPTEHWQRFHERWGAAPSVEDGWLAARQSRHDSQHFQAIMASQFGTLGAGNHFVELSEDAEGLTWAIVHSGSRGIGNNLAMAHVRVAQEECAGLGPDLEHRDLSFLTEGTPEFDRYIADMLWAQHYAAEQREAMMLEVLAELRLSVGTFETLEGVNCHHNYSERQADGTWLSRKGAVNASTGTPAVLPGSMGTDTYIVRGLGNALSYETAPHGAGRVSSRGRPARGDRKATGAYARFTVEEFKELMDARGVVWQDRDANTLLDESPMVYKPIEVVLADSADLIEPVHRLQQFVNYKGL